MSILAIGSWVVGKVMAFAGSNIVRGAIDIYNKAQDSNVRLAEIDASTGQVIHANATNAAVTLQTTKMNWPVFWVIIAVMIGAPAFTLWSVTLYNIFWWEHGIWPQEWAIAAYPPSVAPWVEMSIMWLYDPVGVPSTVAGAGFAAWLTGKTRK